MGFTDGFVLDDDGAVEGAFERSQYDSIQFRRICIFYWTHFLGIEILQSRINNIFELIKIL